MAGCKGKFILKTIQGILNYLKWYRYLSSLANYQNGHLSTMKHLLLLTVLFSTIFPVALKSQTAWKRETGFRFGLVLPKTPSDYYDLKIGGALKIGTYQSWAQSEKRFSFRPEIGLDIERLSVGLNTGGLGGGMDATGVIYGFNLEFACLAQLKLIKNMVFAIGPTGKYLLTSYTKVTEHYWMSFYPNAFSNEFQINGFNRKYLYQPSFGFKAMLFTKNLNDKCNLGFSFERLWFKNNQTTFIYYSETTTFSLYLGF